MDFKIGFLLLLFFPVTGWSQSEFVGRYRAVSQRPDFVRENVSIDGCETATEIEVIYDPGNNKLFADYGNSDFITMFFDEINTGKKEFSSCWSDGIMGYSETTAKTNLLKSITIYKNSGFMCNGGMEKNRHIQELSLKGNILIYRDYWKPTSALSEVKCVFERL